MTRAGIRASSGIDQLGLSTDTRCIKNRPVSTSLPHPRKHHLLLMQVRPLPDPRIGKQCRLTVTHGDAVQMVRRVKNHGAGHIDALVIFAHRA